MESGFTDDLFPANETIRFYNRTRTQYPDADGALFLGDIGHLRAQNKSDVQAALSAAENAWMDHYVKGVGAEPAQGVTAYTTTCPGDVPSGGPYTAPDWARIAKGEVRLDAGGAITIDPTAGSESIAVAFNPIGGGGACAQAPGADQTGTATYRLDPAPAGGYTLLGSPTVIADFTLPARTRRSPRACSTWRPTVRSGSSPAASGVRQRAGPPARSSSSSRTRGRSPRATCRSSSCFRPTPTPARPADSAGARTASSR